MKCHVDHGSTAIDFLGENERADGDFIDDQEIVRALFGYLRHTQRVGNAAKQVFFIDTTFMVHV